MAEQQQPQEVDYQIHFYKQKLAVTTEELSGAFAKASMYKDQADRANAEAEKLRAKVEEMDQELADAHGRLQDSEEQKVE